MIGSSIPNRVDRGVLFQAVEELSVCAVTAEIPCANRGGKRVTAAWRELRPAARCRSGLTRPARAPQYTCPMQLPLTGGIVLTEVRRCDQDALVEYLNDR